MLTLIVLSLIFLLCYGITHKAIPFLFSKIGTALGFDMKITPLTQKRINKFKSIKRGYYCFVLISTLFVMSLGLELFVNNKPLYIRYKDTVQYPAVSSWVNFYWFGEAQKDQAQKKDFGLEGDQEIDYRSFARWKANPEEALEQDAKDIEADITQDTARFRESLAIHAKSKNLVYDPNAPLPEFKTEQYKKMQEQADYLRGLKPLFASNDVSIMMPIIPFSYSELLTDLPGNPPHKPFQPNLPTFGTDFDGKSVTAQILYGFRVGFGFALMVSLAGNIIGVSIGGMMGYFGGWFDIIVQRFIEIWSSIPFLFTIMIIASIATPSFWIMVFLLVLLRAWIGITYTMRGEFYREKARDYVQAARSIGVKDFTIMRKHILPNSLVPLVTYAPFEIVAYIGTLVSLDYLGFGLGADTPSWGKLLRQGADNFSNYPHLVGIPIIAFASTLFCVVMIGEAVREAFDPKEYARLR